MSGLAVTTIPMCPVSLDAVLAIENQAYSHPWTRTIFADCIQAGYICLLYYVDSAVGSELVGYSVHYVAVGEAHLLNICVAPAWQGKGLGHELMKVLIADARARNALKFYLEVRVSNAAAIALYQREGFCEVGRRVNYYPGVNKREDALVFALSLE